MRFKRALVTLLFAFLAQTSPAQVLITEILAGGGTLADEDGDKPDWIELYNSGTTTINLAGWHLTDDPAAPGMWTFPVTNLPPGGFLVVFASGKNRAVPGARLHANFQLNSAGDYLGLIRPDGSVAHEHAPKFPPQVDGVSYGIQLTVSTNRFFGAGAPVKWRTPLSAADRPADWAGTNFNDSGWTSGHIGVGFDAGGTNLFLTSPSTNLARGRPTTQSSTNGAYTPNLAVNGVYSDFTHTLAGANLPATWEVNLGTNYALERIVLWNRASCCQSRLRDITVRILDLSGATNYTSALLNPENVLGGGVLNVGPASLTLNLTQLTGGLVIGGRIRVTRTPDPDLSGSGGAGSTSEPDVLALGEVEVFGGPFSGSAGSYNSLIQTDLLSPMRNVNASALLRVHFNIPEEEMPILNQLTLRAKYDDGFVAWLNGAEVARRNAPASLAWNSAATNQHPDSATLLFEDIDISPFIGLLQEGDNVLAIHGLNLTAADDDFLIVPELVGASVTIAPDRYFAVPTPGTVNGGAALGIVADTKFTVDRGFFDVPFNVGITTATVGAQIHFSTDGSPPSAVTGVLYTNPIPINRSTVLRAIATKPGWVSTAVDTETYIFLGNVLTQNVQSAIAAGLPASWPGVTADYDMDPNVTVPYASQMRLSLRSLPTVFITATASNLFDANTGIYTHPTSHGLAWECPASLEMLGTNGQSEFHLNCGLRIQGGAFRSFSYTEKKSLRVLFKSQYGPGRLNYDLFKEPGAAQDFDSLVFRAGGNDGYAWSSAGTTVQFTRDEFGRRLLLDMGHPSPRGMFVHLYLNGLYWGLYNLVEHPNEDFSASYLGGNAADWDSITSKSLLKNGDFQAWTSLTNQIATLSTFADYQRIQGNNPDGTRNTLYPVLFDKVDYIDYMLLNIWGGNWDWPNNNYWIGRNRTADSTGFKFYPWDYENTLGNNLSRSPTNMVSPKASDAALGVGVPHYFLKNFSEYKMDFADRVQKYCFNGGFLTPQAASNRFLAIDNALQPAIVAESARWGDDNHTPPYGLADWLGERDWILQTYLAVRTPIVLDQLRASGLFPALSAPFFSQFGGAVTAGYNLVISQTNASGTIFITLDGSDPRAAGQNTVAPGAQPYTGPIIVNSPTLVRARVQSGAAWSAVVEAVFYPPQDLSRLELTEIMYHPPNLGSTNGDEFEFIELKNTGTNTLNLSGLNFSAGITFTFTNGATLGPGQFYVLARNAAAFAAKYPGVALQGIYSGKLDNGGEELRLSEALGATVFSVSYGTRTPWPVTPDGSGFSLVQKFPGTSQAPDNPGSWRASSNIAGSPGSDDPAPAVPAVVISEILTHTDLPQVDAIELFNPEDEPADLSGWFLTDDPTVPKKFRIPDATVLQPGARTYFTEAQFNNPPGASNSFALNSAGDDVYLFSALTNGELTGYSHGVAFGAAFNGVSFGRYINSAGEEWFPAQTSVTLGAPNSGPRVGPVVINEINFHPDALGDEFVELLNITSAAVPLFDPAHTTNAWRLSGLNYAFTANTSLSAYTTLLLVATNPAAFRAKYNVPAAVEVLGPVSGVLQDSGELLELQAPDAPNTNGLVPYVTIDQVRYNDKAPWPAGADGTGLSLQRLLPSAYGNDPTNWIAAAPSPGQGYGSSDTDGDGLPDSWELAHGSNPFAADSDADPDHDGQSNLQEYFAGTNPNDPNSALKFDAVGVMTNLITLQFQAVSNHSYSVLYSPLPAGGVWTKLCDTPAPSTNRIATVTDSLSIAPRFFRLVTPAQP